jgi:hypothetical protein
MAGPEAAAATGRRGFKKIRFLMIANIHSAHLGIKLPLERFVQRQQLP